MERSKKEWLCASGSFFIHCKRYGVMAQVGRNMRLEEMLEECATMSLSEEKEEFSSGGNRHLIILRGKWGLAIDTFVLWLTGYSLMTKQYTYANGAPYQ